MNWYARESNMKTVQDLTKCKINNFFFFFFLEVLLSKTLLKVYTR